MKLRNMLWLLLALLLVIAPITTFASEDGGATDGTTTEGSESAQESESTDWTPEDFTYGEWKIGETEKIAPADDPENYLTITAWVVTGLSSSGQEKMKTRSDLVIPDKDPDGRKVQGVGEKAFYENYAVQSVTFPENVTAKVRSSEFNRGYCWKTSEDDGVPEERGDFFIGERAFGSASLSNVTISEGTLYVGNRAFGYNSFKSITLPSSLMVIDEHAFYSTNYRELTEINFPETTTFPLNVRYEAFSNLSTGTIWLPAQTMQVAKKAFAYSNIYTTTKLFISESRYQDSGYFVNDGQQAYFGRDIPTSGWAQRDWCAYHFTYSDDGATVTGLSEAGKEKLKKDSAIVIPSANENGVTTTGIGDNAFQTEVDESTGSATGVTEVSLPDTLKTIGYRAFYGAPLSKVDIPDSVTTIGENAFSTQTNAQTKITEAKLSENLTEIAPRLFWHQNLTKIDIPEGVTAIGEYAFAGNPLTELSLPKTVTTIGKNAFEDHQLTEIKLPSGVKTIGEQAFMRASSSLTASVNKITLNEGLESIGKEAFFQALTSGCTEAELPTTVTALDSATFKGNKKTITLYSKVADQASGSGDYSEVSPTGDGHQIVYLPKVTFDANGGTCGTSEIRLNPDRKLNWLPEATRDGYTFDGWYTEAQEGDPVKTGADSQEYTEDATVYAHWTMDIIHTTPTVTLSAGTYTYDGKVKTPGVTVKAEGKALTQDCYDVSYSSGRTNVGTYQVTVTLKGNYEGSKVVSFKINPKGTSLKTVKKAKKAFKVTWKKQATQTTGYQIQYATAKNFKSSKTKTVTSNKKVSLTVKKLKSKKKYYMRIRTYKKVSGVTYYSSWSGAKTVKTK